MNKTDLKRYRGRLLGLRERLEGEVRRMSETVLTDGQPLGEHDRHFSETPEKELALEQCEEAIGRRVLEALERLDQGTFGVCQECGGPIGVERLDAMPYAPYCVECERKLELEGG